jgi:hypothetical protein
MIFIVVRPVDNHYVADAAIGSADSEPEDRAAFEPSGTGRSPEEALGEVIASLNDHHWLSQLRIEGIKELNRAREAAAAVGGQAG